MTSQFNWHCEGQGPDLVLIHGWGMNTGVWQDVIPRLSQHYCVHWCDLPGYGDNGNVSATSLNDIVELLLVQAPEKAVWLGWSLGGVIATQAALVAPQRVTQLITVASSPCFRSQTDWMGIQPRVLANFQLQLVTDFALTIERFLVLQALGSQTAKEDIRQLKAAVLSRPQPQLAALTLGLELLETVDLRQSLTALSQPWLRLYGRLDALVPIKTEPLLGALYPQSQSYIFANASHAPFISHLDEFITVIKNFMT
ncbi:pimeloyl-ACP methyl ester esterase BioH [Photobacterium carnosum]|uniref:pimeloyl-ACP methyl ester esterase BioH n=1 Tax=Photobacterium carnosum TaxID=2023717 RepID=UPI001E3BDF12|nr:pimeloyl-ACP methyl ester esterase BioH [Photobacterium carnosum]MCD9494630.1 pimeloyl-ACP methyl ester esterase BioH [Photobacterium carnosum]MCD9499416.1 pimeloyl-ACP methyl ester esterase BioH [Photobacterium carnosum]MCD9522197.1 pimeloyl-ACP methyl ester esterase BioH [Photobacterium carnosum]MCD9537619.1 pimeloyl-ACP methyl ester esterase BioH [Photobacterium carnosum]MCD9545161.1 pimeloyl-ACP methyl ester esterase BioH [Photobacterium carnosum]